MTQGNNATNTVNLTGAAALQMVFSGNVRYRVPWDFVLALLAAVALARLRRRA